MRIRFRWMVLALTMVLMLAACGDSTDDGAAGTVAPGDDVVETTAPADDGGETTTSAAAPEETSAPAEDIVLTFWNYWDGKNGEVVQGLADRYSAETPGVSVENVFVGWGDLLPKLQTATAGGDGPDVAAGDLVWMPKLAESGALVALDDMAAAAGVDLDDFYPNVLAVDQYDGGLYGLPVSTNNLQLFVNEDLFTAAGLDPATPPTDWDELRSMAATCTNADDGVFGMELFTEPGEGLTWQFQVYLWQAGGEFLTADFSAAAFNDAAGAAALQYWVDLLQVDG